MPLTSVVVLYPGCTIAEVIELTTRLAGFEAEVVVAAVDGAPIEDQSGLRMLPDVTIAALDPAGVDLVVVAGGDPGSVIDDPQTLGFLEAADSAGATTAAICAGVLLVAAAGLVTGRHITHNYRAPWAPEEVERFVDRFWTDAVVEPDPTVGVVVDGRLVTALPNATVDFTVTVLETVGLVDGTRGDHLRTHLRGGFVAELHG